MRGGLFVLGCTVLPFVDGCRRVWRGRRRTKGQGAGFKWVRKVEGRYDFTLYLTINAWKVFPKQAMEQQRTVRGEKRNGYYSNCES